MIKTENIFSHEIIGLYAKIEDSPDKSLINLSGKIILETKNMIGIKTKAGVKHISKSVAKILKLQLPAETCFVNGSLLIGRPEDRVTR